MKAVNILKTAIVATVSIAALAGCASKKPDPEPVVQQAEEPERPAHQGPVCMLERWLPTGMKYEKIDSVDVKKRWYGNPDAMLTPLADEAREMGANVVMRVKTGVSVGLIAWAAPYAEGDAVFAPDMTDEICEKLKGKML